MKKSEQREQAIRARDWTGFYQEYSKESDRSAAILIAGMTQFWLRELLRALFVDDPKAVENLLDNDRPLSSFGGQILAAYCLGLITKHEKDDLLIIKNIRNRFAHQLHGLSFNDKSISDECDKLNTAAFDLPQYTDELREIIRERTGGRSKYFRVGFHLAIILRESTNSTNHIVIRPEGKWVKETETLGDDGTVKSEQFIWKR